MSCQLNLSISSIEKKEIWNGFAYAHLHETDITAAKACLESLLKYAKQIYDDHKNNANRTIVYERIRKKRGIKLQQKITSFMDSNNIKGLIGEMIVEDFIRQNKFCLIYTKWRRHGTSKSNGIDLIGKNDADSNDQLLLTEAKHVHSLNPNPKSAIKERFEEGLSEFEKEKTLLNLSGIASEISEIINKNRAYGKQNNELEDECKIIENNIKNENYKIKIVSCVDKTKTNTLVFDELLKNIKSTTYVGNNQELSLDLLKILELEQTSKMVLNGT